MMYTGMSYWAWAVRDTGNNSLHAKHAKDSPFPFPSNPAFVWFYHHYIGNEQEPAEEGMHCTKHSAKTK